MLIQFSENGDWYNPRNVAGVVVRSGKANIGRPSTEVIEVAVMGVGEAGHICWVLEPERITDAILMRDGLARMVNAAIGVPD